MSLTCPACSHPLTAHPAGGIELDLCQDGCGGIWFDNFELKRMDEEHEALDPSLGEVRYDPERPVKRGKRHCPRCQGQPMRTHAFSAKRQVMVDSCPSCAGVFLDRGELEALRAEFPTEQARTQAAFRAFEREFADQMAEDRAESQAKVERAQAFAHALRFILPSYWIPGKQDGAAY